MLDDAIDVHVHTAPDLVERYETDVALARSVREAGMAAVVVKSHVVPTMVRAQVVNEAVGTDVLRGGVALNGSVGGLNPSAVETALELGAAIVWLPTAWSANHASQARAAGVETFVGQPVPGPDEELHVVDGGRLVPAVREVIDLVADHDAVLGTGHVAPEVAEAVVEACTEAGADVLVNHPFFRVVDMDLDRQRRLAEMGAVMEYCAYSIESTEGHTVERVADAVAEVGPEHCLLATDFGQVENPPVPGLERFASEVAAAGAGRDTVRRCVTEVPRRLLGTAI